MEKHQDWSGDKKKNERKTWARVFSVVFTGKTCETQSAAEQAWNWIVWIIAMNSWLYERRQWHPTPVLLAWKIPWTEEPGRLQSMGSLRVGQDWETSLSLFTSMPWRRKQQPTPLFLPGESQGWRSLVGCRLWSHTELDTTEATWQQQLGYVGSFYLSDLIADPGMIEGRGSGTLCCRSLTIWGKWEFELEMGWLHIKDIFASKNYPYETKTKLLKSS